MLIKSVLCSFCCVLLLSAAMPLAMADIVHSVNFSAKKTVILWGGETSHVSAAPISGMPRVYSEPQSKFAVPIVQTGFLEPVNAHVLPLDQQGSSRATFNVVSNTAYGIRAEVSQTSQTTTLSELAAIPFAFDLKSVGAKATAPESAAFYVRNLSLADLVAPRTVFSSGQKTAAQRGAPADQSLEFEAAWAPLKTGEPVEISFTVFVP